MTVGQSPMFLLGLFFLTLSATHVFSVLSNTTSQFRLLSQWNDKDEELFKKIWNNDPKKVSTGIVLSITLIDTDGSFPCTLTHNDTNTLIDTNGSIPCTMILLPLYQDSCFIYPYQ